MICAGRAEQLWHRHRDNHRSAPADGSIRKFSRTPNVRMSNDLTDKQKGGFLTYSIDTSAQFNEAISDFSFNNTDPKAQAVVVYTSDGTLVRNQ